MEWHLPLYVSVRRGRGEGIGYFFIGKGEKMAQKICKFCKLVFNFVLLLVGDLLKGPLKEVRESYGYSKDRSFGSP